jgi:hypothetical protein
LSTIASAGSGYPSVKLKTIGDSVTGRIVGYEDYQMKEFGTNELKFWEKSGDPMMATRIDLEMNPGDASSRVSLYVEKKNMRNAIRNAVIAAAGSDIEEGADLAVTFSGLDGRSHAFQAAYARPDVEAQAA